MKHYNFPTSWSALQTLSQPSTSTKRWHCQISWQKLNTIWNRIGVVKSKHNTAPRSYNIHTDKDTEIRRNRRHLLQSRSTFDVKDDIPFEEAPNTEAFNTETPNPEVSNTEAPNTETQNTDASDRAEEATHHDEVPTPNEVRTRSGRLIVKPARYRQ